MEWPNPSSWLVGAAGVTIVAGTGDCKHGDRRIGPGDGLLEQTRWGNLGCPASRAGSASSDIDVASGVLGCSVGTYSRQGGGGNMSSHLAGGIDVDSTAVDQDDEVAAGGVVLAEIGGATCEPATLCDDCGVARMIFT